jgi:hypothetical protein
MLSRPFSGSGFVGCLNGAWWGVINVSGIFAT